MSNTTLDFKITVKGDEATLRDIRSKLTSTGADCPDLNNVLSVIVQQTLMAAGVSGDFEVEFNCGNIRRPTQRGGGLNAHEWLEKGKPS
jgi:hypothetical protein